jgi:hypothetical protein
MGGSGAQGRVSGPQHAKAVSIYQQMCLNPGYPESAVQNSSSVRQKGGLPGPPTRNPSPRIHRCPSTSPGHGLLGHGTYDSDKKRFSTKETWGSRWGPSPRGHTPRPPRLVQSLLRLNKGQFVFVPMLSSVPTTKNTPSFASPSLECSTLEKKKISFFCLSISP